MRPIKVKGVEYKNYLVDTEGNIYTQEGNLMKQHLTHEGYLRVKLSKGLKRGMYLVHRIVAETYLDNPKGFPIVHHKNSVRNDNRVSNLEWCDNSHNQKERFKNQLGTKAKEVLQICPQTGKIINKFPSPIIAEKELGICRQNISKVAKGKRNHAGGFVWKYAS